MRTCPRLCWIENGEPPHEDAPRPQRTEIRDQDVLDAYSQAVVDVVDLVSPAAISISTRRARGSGGGSGFLISPDGYALTNSHVIHGAETITAETYEGDHADADLVGDDPATDLALVRLTVRDLPHAEMGDSDALRVGQLVIAAGSPLGFHATVSTGIVSAVGRSLRGRDGRLIENVIQHTAPINPGNSGGPLVDSGGCVVGVNTAIIVAAQGIGFAVPSATAKWVIGELLVHGRVRRRKLGIVATTVHLPRAVVRELDLISEKAIQVIEVEPGSAAARAGLRSGDIIVSLQGRIVTSVDDVHRLLSTPTDGESLSANIVRDRQRLEIMLSPKLS